MNDCMTFPDTVEEFMEQYKVVDTEHIYTNGSEFVPVFRMKQWFEHLPSEQSEPEAISKWKKEFREYVDSLDIARDDWKGIIEYIDELPSAQPFHIITMTDVMKYIDDMPEDVWLEFTCCLECRGWELQWCGGDDV